MQKNSQVFYVTEYWNENLTEASWRKLQKISQEYDFILIGGWATYLWTSRNKSKDIDIIVDFKTLERLKQDYNLKKNDKLKKYEIKTSEFDIDVYVPYYSDLVIPLNEVKTTKIQGIKTLAAEELLILKQDAEIDRRNTVKGKKDSIDIITLLMYADINIKRYKKLLKNYNIVNFRKELKKVINNFNKKDIKYLEVDFKEFKDWQKEILKELR